MCLVPFAVRHLHPAPGPWGGGTARDLSAQGLTSSASRASPRAFRQVLNDHLSMTFHAHTLYWMYRPFGISAIVAAMNDVSREAELYMVEPSGVSYVRHPAFCLSRRAITTPRFDSSPPPPPPYPGRNILGVLPVRASRVQRRRLSGWTSRP